MVETAGVVAQLVTHTLGQPVTQTVVESQTLVQAMLTTWRVAVSDNSHLA